MQEKKNGSGENAGKEARRNEQREEERENKGSVGKALLRLQQSFSEEEEKEESLQRFYAEAGKPRKKEYIEQVLRCMNLGRRIAELRTKLAKEEGVPEKHYKRREPQKEEIKNSSPVWLPKATTGAPAVETIEWKGAGRNPLLEELERLEGELEREQKRLYEQLPKGDPYLASVYLTTNREELYRRGIISCSGTPYFGPEDLIEKCNVTTEQECKVLRLGDQALLEMPSPLIVEVYLHAVCKVYGDGSVQMIRK